MISESFNVKIQHIMSLNVIYFHEKKNKNSILIQQTEYFIDVKSFYYYINKRRIMHEGSM